jgi:hypothetical protein
MPTVTTSFIDLHDEHRHIRTYAFKDSPLFCEAGTSQDFTHLEVLALLTRCGLTDDEAQGRLELILRAQRMQRFQFRLTDQQFKAVSDTFIEPIPDR